MKKILPLFLLLGFASSLVSCSNDEDYVPYTPNVKLLPVKITWVNTSNDEVMTSVVYSYDDQNRLISKEEVSGDALKITVELAYNTQGELTKETRSIRYDGVEGEYRTDIVTEYVHQGSEILVDFSSKSYVADELESHLTKEGSIRLNERGWLDRYDYELTLQYSERGGMLMGNRQWEKFHYDGRGNLLGTAGLDMDVIWEYEKTREWDNKNGIFVAVNTPQWYLVRVDLNGLNYIVNNIKGVSRYNEEGYPVEIESHSAASSIPSQPSQMINIEYVSAK